MYKYKSGGGGGGLLLSGPEILDYIADPHISWF